MATRFPPFESPLDRSFRRGDKKRCENEKTFSRLELLGEVSTFAILQCVPYWDVYET